MTTPMRSQYLAIKKQYPDIILLFRLGDFYETFDDDARIVASVCDVVLTSCPVGADERVPLAGVPYHAIDGYIAKLINAGYKVAIAEQIGNEPPKGRSSCRASCAASSRPAHLWNRACSRRSATTTSQRWCWTHPSSASLSVGRWAGEGGTGRAGVAYADISTGEFAATEIAADGDLLRRVAEELGRLSPAEVLYPAKDPRWAGRTASDEGRTANAGRAKVAVRIVTHYAARLDPILVGAVPRHPLHRLALRGGHRAAGAARSFQRGFLGGIRLRRQTARRTGRGRAAPVSPGSSKGWPGPDHWPAHLQHRRVHDAGRGHPAQSGADREHPGWHGPGLAARRARCDTDTHGRAGIAPPAEPTAA